MCTGAQLKAAPLQEPGRGPPSDLRGSPGEAKGGCSSPAEVQDKHNDNGASREHDWCELSWRPPFRHQDQGPANNLQAPLRESLRPNNQLCRNTAPPSHQKTGCLGFLGGPVIGNPAANAGDTGSHPWSGKIPRAAEQLELCATTTEARSLNRAPQRETPVHATGEHRTCRRQRKPTRSNEDSAPNTAKNKRATNNIQGIPIRLSTDLRLFQQQQCRSEDSEWLNIFKVMKRKNRQPRTPSKVFIQIQLRNQKLYRQAKAKRTQHHKTN